jgi:hypothetical protein
MHADSSDISEAIWERLLKETAAIGKHGLELEAAPPYPGAKPYPVAGDLLVRAAVPCFVQVQLVIRSDAQLDHDAIAEDLAGHHHHLLCQSCGSVSDVSAAPKLEQALSEAARLVGKTPAARCDMASREENIRVIETLGIERPQRAALPADSSTTLSSAILNQTMPAKVRRVPVARPAPKTHEAEADEGFSFD